MRLSLQPLRFPNISFFRGTQKNLLLCAALLGICSPVCASAEAPAAWWGEVTYVVDGDTVHVRPEAGGKPVKVRMQGIDAPEICQDGGALSRDALLNRLGGQRVQVVAGPHDDYGRLLAKIEFNGKDMGRWMVAQGMAWSYRSRRYAGPYAAEQRRARSEGRGLFSREDLPPLYPATFRRQHGSCHL